ncbi:hypothetical protein HO173_012915 [Letharia columbiana]|uniref:Mannose-6-phosphate isomerase n=1 Tax=Letharia columbiana TaxID=112416 RepID=A0A8H6FE95_9LECA|nr:uncharacterized protein HO173_012915 [Letharia columbiana]KAF6224674.1 hypothetical protein HO173_012915 [Letharia columbiana]
MQVAALTAAGGAHVDHEKPYAELWMGTHPSGPAMLAAHPATSLQDWLEKHSQALGATVLKRFGLKLPFLFKVLSVETALSIQSHPDKELAEKLHAQQPEIYKDNNHKPEMALAITDFEALCGFVSTQELSGALQSIPELTAVVGKQHADAVLKSCSNSNAAQSALKDAFTTLMKADPSAVAEQVEILDDRLQQKQLQEKLTPKEKLQLMLLQTHPWLSGWFFRDYFSGLGMYARKGAQWSVFVQDQRIRACKDNTVLESDFDEVLGQHATQDQVFAAAQGCVDSVLEGYNGSVLAYKCITIKWTICWPTFAHTVNSKLMACALGNASSG